MTAACISSVLRRTVLTVWLIRAHSSYQQRQQNSRACQGYACPWIRNNRKRGTHACLFLVLGPRLPFACQGHPVYRDIRDHVQVTAFRLSNLFASRTLKTSKALQHRKPQRFEVDTIQVDLLLTASAAAITSTTFSLFFVLDNAVHMWS